MVDGEADGDDSFKRPGAVPFNWEIKPGVPKTRNSQPDYHTLLRPPKKLSPLRLKPFPSSSISESKTSPVSPFAPPPSYKYKPSLDSPRSTFSGPPTPYFRSSTSSPPPKPYLRSSSSRGGSDSSSVSFRRWRFLKSLFGLKNSKSSGDVKKTGQESLSSDSEDFYESETMFSTSEKSNRGSVTTRWSSPRSSFSSLRGSPLKRNQSDLGCYNENKTILILARDRRRR